MTEMWPPHEIPVSCPVTGELIAADDVDALLNGFERANRQNKVLFAFLQHVRFRLGELAVACSVDPAAVTQRVRGERRRARVCLADVSFDQRLLKEIVAGFPSELVSSVVAVDSYKVLLREYKKLSNQSGPDLFLAFRAALDAACRGRVGLPTITIEQ